MNLQGRIAQIHRSAFAHPEDLAALEALSKIPVLPGLLKALAGVHAEKEAHAHASMNSLRLGPAQFPSLYRIVCRVAQGLGVAVPEAYLSAEDSINAFAFGMNRHTITLTGRLVDLMTDAEIEAIVAHELGHIVCEHMLYKSLGSMLADQALSSLVPSPLVSAASSTLTIALKRWSRAAEYSADRVALLVTGNPEQVASMLGRLAGPTLRYAHEYNAMALLEQNLEETDPSLMTKLTLFSQELFRTHPDPVKRIGAIMDWSRSEQYHAIRAGRFLTRLEYEAQNQIQIQGLKSCVSCNTPVGQLLECPQCGISQDPNRHGRCGRGHVNDAAWKFCRVCGSAVQGPLLLGG